MDLHCDLCDVVENADDLTPDWNGETGNHLSCEAREEARNGAAWERWDTGGTRRTATLTPAAAAAENRGIPDGHRWVRVKPKEASNG